MLRLNVLLSKLVLLDVDSSWMRMRIVYVLQDMLLMRMEIVCHAHQIVGLLLTHKDAVFVIAQGDSFLIQLQDAVYVHQDKN